MQFNFMLRNNPKTIIEGHIATKSQVEYFFKIFGAVAILCIESNPKIGNDAERLDVIAQVIAECDGEPDTYYVVFCCRPQSSGCDLNNAKHGFLYLFTAFSATVYPSNSSSLKEPHQTHLFSVDVFPETRSTYNVACKYPTLRRRRLLSHSSSSFVAYARQSLT